MVKKLTKYDLVELYLNDYGKRYYLRELASALNKPHQTIKPYAELLVKQEVLNKHKRKNLVEYTLNIKNKKACDFLIIAEKEKLILRLEKEMLFRILYDGLSSCFYDVTCIIFGSGTVRLLKDSDIDLIIIGNKDISKEIKHFEEVYNKKIHKIQVSSIEKLDLSLIKEVYKKHIILNNTELVVNFFNRLYEKNKLV